MVNFIGQKMPNNFESLPQNWDDIDDECQLISLNCPWTITSENETLTVVIIGLKWTFKYDFWIKVTAHPEGKTNVSKQININQHHAYLHLYQRL